MRYDELEVVKHTVNSSGDIKKQIGLNLSYNELKKTVHYELGKEVRENIFTSEEIEKILLDIQMYEDDIEDEYILALEELEIRELGEDSYMLALYYILEDVEFGYIKTLRTTKKEIDRILKRR